MSAGSVVVMVPCQLCVVTGTGCLGHCTPGDINCYLTGPGEGGGGRGERTVSVLIIAVIVPLSSKVEDGMEEGGRGKGEWRAIFRYN